MHHHTTTDEMTYLHTPRSDHSDLLHGVRVADPYRWLEELDSGPTRAWIEAQNRLTADFLDRVPSRAAIRSRVKALWDHETFGIPWLRAGRIFIVRNDGLQDQDVLYWAESTVGEPQVLIDPNGLADDGTVALTGLAVSNDGRHIAYGLSSAGSDWQEWRVREVDTGRDLDDHLRWVKFSDASWDHANRGFYYSRYDEPPAGEVFKGANYYQKLFYHRLGSAQADDALIYERTDHKEWGFGGRVTDDGRFLIISVWKGTHRENACFFMDLAAHDGQAVELLPDFDASYTFIGNTGATFYFVTDRDAPLSRLVAIDSAHPERQHWQEIIPESADVLQAVSLVGDRFIATYLHDAHSLVRLFDLSGAPLGEIGLPGIGTTSGFDGRRTDRETFYRFASFTTPGTIYHYDVASGLSTPFRRPTVGFEPDDYVTEQVFYASRDGTRVPMFLVRKKALSSDGPLPTYLYGYGGFDHALTPEFSVSHIAWLEMGGVFAQANLRGGSEYGRAWHEAGSKHEKQNVFDDFIAAAEWLIESGVTSRPQLAIGGHSNGGLLVGACLTQRPELFGACLAGVGVFDMLRFHKFTIGWAWTSDYGSPDDPDDFRTLIDYSPYHNVTPATAYPPTMITTGDHDDRVFPAHSFKFAAALQHSQASSAPVLIRIDTRAGHSLGKPRAKLIEEAADGWAFLAAAVGLAVPDGAEAGSL